MTVRLVDEAGIPIVEATPLDGQYGMSAEAWAEYWGVPEHTKWNLHLHDDEKEIT